MLRVAVAQGPSKSHRIGNDDGYLFFSRAISCSGKRPAKQGLPLFNQTAIGFWSCHREQAGKGCSYRYIGIPELTLNRGSSVGRQGAPFPRTSRRLVVMPCLGAHNCSRPNLSRQAGRGGACMN